MKRSVSNSDVRGELWGSFVSLLKAYAAGASLAGIGYGVLALGKDSVMIVAALGTLKISYHPTIGRGVWTLLQGTDRHQSADQPEQLEQGNFDLNLDGTITLDGEVLEMDFAAIHLIGELTQAASVEGIEVPA